MAGKRIDPSTIDEKAILEIVAGKNNQIGLSHGVSHKIKIAVGNAPSNALRQGHTERNLLSSTSIASDQIDCYREAFLQTEFLLERQSLHIEKRLHHQITALVNAAGSNATVSGFVTRVLSKHFEEYGSQIGMLLDQYYKTLKR